MSPDQIEGPFDTIESAHEFMTVLAATAVEAIGELGRDRARALREGDLAAGAGDRPGALQTENSQLLRVQRPAGAERSAHSSAADIERADDARKRHCGDVIVMRRIDARRIRHVRRKFGNGRQGSVAEQHVDSIAQATFWLISGRALFLFLHVFRADLLRVYRLEAAYAAAPRATGRSFRPSAASPARTFSNSGWRSGDIRGTASRAPFTS